MLEWFTRIALVTSVGVAVAPSGCGPGCTNALMTDCILRADFEKAGFMSVVYPSSDGGPTVDAGVPSGLCPTPATYVEYAKQQGITRSVSEVKEVTDKGASCCYTRESYECFE